MSTDLFQALTLGLLVIVILALLVTVSMLGRIRATLENRSSSSGTDASATRDAAAETSPEPEVETGPVALLDEPPAERAETVAVDEAAETPAAEAETPPAEGAGEDSERPFERGGRWYFHRGGELLVYEEGTGEWVPAPASGDARPAVTSHAETVAASTEPSTVEPEGDAVAPAGAETAESLEPSTSFAGQPLANAEESVATIGEGDAVEERGSAVATAFEEPGGGEIVPEEAPEEVAARPSESFWRCPSCGAVNGSTATSCRMCFAAKP